MPKGDVRAFVDKNKDKLGDLFDQVVRTKTDRSNRDEVSLGDVERFAQRCDQTPNANPEACELGRERAGLSADRIRFGPVSDQCPLPHAQSMSPCHVRCTVMPDAQKCATSAAGCTEVRRKMHRSAHVARHVGCTVSFRVHSFDRNS